VEVCGPSAWDVFMRISFSQRLYIYIYIYILNLLRHQEKLVNWNKNIVDKVCFWPFRGAFGDCREVPWAPHSWNNNSFYVLYICQSGTVIWREFLALFGKRSSSRWFQGVARVGILKLTGPFLELLESSPLQVVLKSRDLDRN